MTGDDEPGLLCCRCRLRHLDVKPIPTADGSEKFECQDRQACMRRRQWLEWKRRKK